MRPNYSTTTSRLLIIALVACSLNVPLAAQLTSETARGQAAEATRLLESGRYREAVSLTERGLGECGDDGYCRSRLRYTLGYLYQLQSRRETPAVARVLLAKSATSYDAVLSEFPAHWPTLSNLVDVYARLGQPGEAKDALQRGLNSLRRGSVEAGKRARLAIAVGELYLDDGQGPESVEAFRMAADALPMQATPKRRMIEAYSLLPEDRLASEIEALETWEEPNPDVANEGYRLIARRLWDKNASAAEAALLRWLRLQAGLGTWGQDSLAGLPEDWTPVAEIENFLREPSARLFRWWLETPERADALGALFLAMGGARRETPREVVRIWKSALDLDPPPPLTDAWIELYTELAILLHRQGFVKANVELFEAIEDRLLDAMADLSKQPGSGLRRGVERLHEVFGLIYAAEGRCGSTTPERGALYHLREAIESSERGRVDSSKPYLPAGHLWGALAMCHRSMGNLQAALETHLDASRAYFDADQLHLADEQLAAADELLEAGFTDRGGRRESLGLVRLLRRLASEPQEYRDGICSQKGIEWTLAEENLSADFVARQRFKTYGDCIRSGNVSASAWASAELLQQVLSEGHALVGPEDVVRFETINRRVAEQERLALNIFSTDEPLDSSLYLRLAYYRPTPGRRFTYIKASDEAVLRLDSHLSKPPRPDDQAPYGWSLPTGTLLRVELLEAIQPDDFKLADQTYRGRLARQVTYAGNVVLTKDSHVTIVARHTCPPVPEGRDGLWSRRRCEWLLKLRSITIDDWIELIDADLLSTPEVTSLGRHDSGDALPTIRASTPLVFVLNRPLRLDRVLPRI